MAPAVARQSADWAATRQLVLDRYGLALGRAIVARSERADGAQSARGHRSPRSGSVALLVDKRTGYATFRGRVLWRGTRYEVYVGVPRGARSLKTYADRCRADLTKKIKELEAGVAPARGKEKTTLRQWAVPWLEMKRVQGVRATTLRHYEGFMRRYILPVLGQVRLGDLTPEMVVGLYASCDGKLSRTSVRALSRCIKTCLHDAVGYPYPVPADLFSKNTRAPRVPRNRHKFVATPAMLRQLLDATRGD